MGAWNRETLRRVLSKRMLLSFLLGLTGGLPLLLTGGTLQAWMKGQNIDIGAIGAMSLVGLPYTLKFLWSPIFDRFSLGFLGRRRGWLAVTQVMCVVALLAMAFGNSLGSIQMFAITALMLSFSSASQDIVIDALRREIVADEELGLGASLYVTGYRIAMLMAGGGALILADHMSWQNVYVAMAAIMSLGLLATFFADEPKVGPGTPKSIREAVIDPFVEFFKRDGAIIVLLFVFFYKVGDQMAGAMSTPLYLDLAFTKTEIGAIVKLFGTWAVVAGGLTGGLLMLRMGIVRSLWVFGIFQMLSTLGFSVLSQVGHSIPWLTGVISFENFTGGMGTAAYTAFMAALTDKRYTATQFALLTSFMGLPRVFAAAPTGFMVAAMGYSWFFVVCTLIAIPGLLLIFVLKRDVRGESQIAAGQVD